MKKVLAVILARGGSKAIYKKNIVLINKHPLIAYTIGEALKSSLVDRVVVSSEDDEIRSIATQYGADASYKRPIRLAKDNTSSIDAIHHIVNFTEKKYKVNYDHVIELMCTNPLKNLKDIEEALKIQINSNAESTIAVMKLEDHHPIRIKKIINNRIVDFCLKEVPETRRQDLKPDAYIRNGSIYCMRRDMVENKIRSCTKKSIPYIMPRERTVNIDEPMDLQVAKVIMKKTKNNPKKLMTASKAKKLINI